jgi:hypothetical protein
MRSDGRDGRDGARRNALEKKEGENALSNHVEDDVKQNFNRLIDDASALANGPNNLSH